MSRARATNARTVQQRTAAIAAAPDVSRIRRYVGLLVPLAVAIALTVVTLSSLTTARGRFAASTESQSLLSAGFIDLVLESGSDSAVQELVFDEGPLGAEQVVSRCLVVRYEGSFETAAIRLHGQPTGGTGLGAYLDVTIERGAGIEPDCGDFSHASTMFAGRLDSLWAGHSAYDAGLRVAEPAYADESTTVKIRIEVIDDNDAQELSTSFVMYFEARP